MTEPLTEVVRVVLTYEQPATTRLLRQTLRNSALAQFEPQFGTTEDQRTWRQLRRSGAVKVSWAFESDPDELLTYAEYRRFAEAEEFDRSWTTQLWGLLLRYADKFGLEIRTVEDPNLFQSRGRAITRLSFERATFRGTSNVPGVGPNCMDFLEILQARLQPPQTAALAAEEA